MRSRPKLGRKAQPGPRLRSRLETHGWLRSPASCLPSKPKGRQQSHQIASSRFSLFELPEEPVKRRRLHAMNGVFSAVPVDGQNIGNLSDFRNPSAIVLAVELNGEHHTRSSYFALSELDQLDEKSI